MVGATGPLQPVVDIVADDFPRLHSRQVAVDADPLEEVGAAGGLEHAGKLGLAGEDDGEEVAVVLLHIGEEPQALEVDGLESVALVDEDENALAFIGGLEEDPVELFEKVVLAPHLARLSLELPDDFPKEHGEGDVGVGDERDPVLGLVEAVEDDAQARGLAEPDFPDYDRQDLVAFLDCEQNLRHGRFDALVGAEVHLGVRHVVERVAVHAPVFVIHRLPSLTPCRPGSRL